MKTRNVCDNDKSKWGSVPPRRNNPTLAHKKNVRHWRKNSLTFLEYHTHSGELHNGQVDCEDKPRPVEDLVSISM